MATAVLIVVVLAGATGAAPDDAPRAGAWSTGSALDACTPPDPRCLPRVDAAAAVLKDGRVLVVGGGGDAGATATIFDPVAGTWSFGGALRAAAANHTMTLLPTGTVLVVGGERRASLFDPATGTWSETPAAPSVHGEHSATMLDSGKVLVAGGLGGLGTAAAVLFNPATGGWEPTGRLIQLRYQHASALLADGRVLVVGGWSENYGPKRNTAELYDPATGRWSPTAAAATAPIDATATLLEDGRVLLAGGRSGEGNSGVGGDVDAQLYDPATGTWARTGSMTAGRSRHTATRLDDGRVLVVGGMRPDQVAAEVFDPATGAWVPTGPMAEARLRHVAARLADGRVLVTGGTTLQSPVIGTELFTPDPAGEARQDMTASTDQVEGPVTAAGPDGASADGDDDVPVLWLIGAGVALMVLLLGGSRALRRH